MNLDRAIETFRRRGFQVSFFETAAAACDYLCSETTGKSVGIGGSKTAQELGLLEKLSKNSTVHWHQMQEGAEVFSLAASAQVYISSANAISETGEIINIDGRGNRVSATLFGHEKLILVAGVNKLAPDFDSAMHRARNIAGPLNARRLGKKTPCALGTELRCYDCSSPDRICRGFVVMTHPMMGMACELVLINETLGY